MNVPGGVKRAATVLLGLVLLLMPAMGSLTYDVRSVSAHDTFADPAFQRVWNHCDMPVEAEMAARSWMWGPEDFYTAYEAYAEGQGGQHLVSYFDKSRMEINDPDGDRNSEWFVTNGLLVVDMISGRIQVGDNMFVQATPAKIPVAGDQLPGNKAPTYASLAGVASLKNDNRAPDRTGQYVREGLGGAGNVGMVNDTLSTLTRYAVYEPTLGHNIPDVFWTFMNQKGITYHDSGYVYDDMVVDWHFAMGYPITEPYWIQIGVDGGQRWVLMQAFQRRTLTYSPYNPDPWKVEMANVGRAYYDWRYMQAGQVTPTPVPVPTFTPGLTDTPVPAPYIAVSPTQGNINTQITVVGRNFPPYSTVTIGVEKSGTRYAHTITVLNAKPDGTFQAQFKLPNDAAQLGSLTITATANAGGIRVTAGFTLVYNPAITVTPREVIADHSIRIRGEGFPAQTEIRLSMVLVGSGESLAVRNTDKDGAFDTTIAIHKAAGTQFRVAAATADGNFKITTDYTITVIRQPSVTASPDRGPVGAYVTFTGSAWPPNRAIHVGTKALNSTSDAWLPNPIYSDANGNFSTSMWVGREYAPYTEVRLIASDPISTVRMEASYYVVPSGPIPTPTPGIPAITISPNAAVVGQVVTATGSGWPAGAQVWLGLGRASVEEAVGVAQADANGAFSHSFILSSRWYGAGQITLTAYTTSGSATAPLWVLSGGRVAPAGMPMKVWTYQLKDNATYISAKGDGWRPNSQVEARIISADGTMNVLLAAATTNSNGCFSVGGYEAAEWGGRTDLGLQVSTPDGQQYSIRYLPLTQMSKIQGTGNTYQATGSNWPASTSIEVVLHLANEPEEVMGTAVSDAGGQFSLQVTLPRIPDNNKNDVEIRAVDQPYCATIDF